MQIPQLETARLLLRPFTQDDLLIHHQLIGSDPRVTWHGKALALEESEAALQRRMQHWQEHGFGMWVVEEKVTGHLLGHAGLQHLEDSENVEVGYYFGQPAWGKGIATEAGAASIRYGFETLGLEKILAVVRPENQASHRVLSKLGLQHVRNEPHYGFDVQVWQIERNAFQPSEASYRLLP